MSLPVPVLRPDAVDHYAELLADDLPADAFCLTAVRGLTLDDAITRFDGVLGGPVLDLREVGEAGVNAYPDELPLFLAAEVDGWVLLAENNGWHGSHPPALQRLSAGTVAVSAFWNVNRDSRISLARNGSVLASLDFVIDGDVPAVLAPYLSGAAFSDSYRKTAEALAFVEHVSGVRLTRAWARERHQASLLVDLTRFGVPGSDAELSSVYQRVLELRWERCRPVDRELDPVALLNLAMTRRYQGPCALEREALVRAKEIAAQLSR